MIMPTVIARVLSSVMTSVNSSPPPTYMVRGLVMALISMITTTTTIKMTDIMITRLPCHICRSFWEASLLCSICSNIPFASPLFFVNFTIAHLSRFVNASRSIFQKFLRVFNRHTVPDRRFV